MLKAMVVGGRACGEERRRRVSSLFITVILILLHLQKCEKFKAYILFLSVFQE